MGAAFGVDPVHQGVIFLANLELGFLTPPVGLNLYLASSRFGKPLTEVTRQAFPFLLIMAVAVLLITYVPDLSLGILKPARQVRRAALEKAVVSLRGHFTTPHGRRRPGRATPR